VRQWRLTWPTLCLLTVLVWALAVQMGGHALGAGPIAWAAPQAGPLAQTVPTVTPIRPRPSTPASSEEQPSPPVPPASASPAATATPAVTPGSQARGTPMATPGQSPPTPIATRESAPTTAWQTAEAIAGAPPALPAPQQCAPAITPAAAVSLPPVYDSSGAFSLAWLVLLGVGTMLVGLGLVVIFRKGE
jgi:hypothetical protein